MDIKNKPTLAEKQAFWAEQLPNFEAKYWLPSHFELLEFDMEGGNYEVRDVLPEHYSEDDASDIYHRVNTGWAMWKKAINFTKAQAVPEGFVLVPVDQLNQWGHMANYAEQYGCPECFEARGYAHTLTCEINEYFAIETQEPTND